MSLFYIKHISKIILYSYYLDQIIKIDYRMKNQTALLLSFVELPFGL